MVHIIPKDDPKQAMRIKRFLMAFDMYIIWLLIILSSYYDGILARSPIPITWIVNLIITINLIIFILIRSGLNRRFKDPSLTMTQMVLGTIYAMFMAYCFENGREVILLLYILVFAFGTFNFKMKFRQYCLISVFAILAYVFVITLLLVNYPKSVDLKMELLNLGTLLSVLIWLSFIGSHMNEMRKKLIRSNNGLNHANNELQKLNAGIKQSEERYRIVAENARDVIWVFDLNLGYTFMSPSVEYLRGYTVEESLKQSLDQMLTPESYKKAMEMFNKEYLLEMDGKRHNPDWSFTTELEMVRKDGSTVSTEVTINILYNEDGTPKGFMGITRDITERKLAEQAFKLSERKYRDLYSNLRDGAASVGLDGTITEFNEAYQAMLGYTAEEIKTLTYEDITPKTWHAIEEGIIKDQVIIRGYSDIYEKEYRRKDGMIFPVELQTYLLRNEKGMPNGMWAFVRDITERKRAEEEKKMLEDNLVRAQKMEAIGTLAGGIAHDFNNLLMGILGNISIMRMNFDDSHPFFDRLSSMEEYVHRGSDLTKQLLGFAMGGKYELKPTHLGEFIRRSSEMFGRTKKEISIHHKVPESLWSIEVDRGQMEQVLLNLYVNAWQAMPGGGSLYLSVENVDLDDIDVSPFDVKPGKYVKMTITDTGVGMDEATKARIFEPFFTTKERGRGTGLGLASVYGIIKNHGGFINVESEINLGTSFLIFLPASDKKVVDEYISKEEVQKGQETVLLIDDEEMILDVGSEMIKGLGYEVITATSGRQGFEIYEQNQDRIDLVILDMIMPDFSGKDTFEVLHRIDPSVRVLLSSGYSLDGQAKEIMQNGCKAFIQKPFTLSELSSKIRGILDE